MLIANINTFSGALARNTDRVDGILAGLERMTGGGAKKASALTSSSAKIVGDNGKILDARVFKASVPASIADEAGVAASLSDAFGKAVSELVVWTCKSI